MLVSIVSGHMQYYEDIHKFPLRNASLDTRPYAARYWLYYYLYYYLYY